MPQGEVVRVRFLYGLTYSQQHKTQNTTAKHHGIRGEPHAAAIRRRHRRCVRRRKVNGATQEKWGGVWDYFSLAPLLLFSPFASAFASLRKRKKKNKSRCATARTGGACCMCRLDWCIHDNGRVYKERTTDTSAYCFHIHSIQSYIQTAQRTTNVFKTSQLITAWKKKNNQDVLAWKDRRYTRVLPSYSR